MANRHAFRFGVINEQTAAPDAWIAHVRRVEALGYSTFLIRDHFAPDYFGDQFAPFAALTAAACATTSLRVGTLVFDNDYRHPVMLAKEAATLDLLSGGRLELGLGAGWLQSEYDQAGMVYDPPGLRIQRLSEAIAVLKGLFAEAPLTFAGMHYTISKLNGFPKPTQRPHPPIFLGGGGKRLLTLAAREAQIIGLAPRLIQGDTPRVDARSLTAAATEEKIGWIREAAGDRFGELELNTYPTGAPAVVTSDPRAEARRRADRIREQTGAELTVEEILDSPHMFIGSIKDLTRKFVDLRERFGISSFLIDDLDALAPVVEELAGQ